MILVLEPDAPQELVESLCRDVESLGVTCEVSRGPREVIIALPPTVDSVELQKLMEERREVDVIPILTEPEYVRQRGRRKFMRSLLAGLGLLSGVAAGIPVVGFLLPPRKQLSQPNRVLGGRVWQLSRNETKLVRLRGKPVLVINDEFGNYHAVSALCTHMNVCQLEWDPSRRLLACPCHDGAFDVHGNVVAGPPPTPLQTFEVEVQGDEIYISREG